MAEQVPTPNDFGDPLDKDLLLGFSEISIRDIESAIIWWDNEASPEWEGVLDNKPIGKKK